MKGSTVRGVGTRGNWFQGMYNKYSARTFVMVAVVAICGVVGFYLLVASHAATQTASVEAEDGIAPAAASIKGNVTGASGGEVVKFGAGTVASNMPLMGISIGGSSAGAGKWDTYRVYRFGGDVDKAVSNGAKLIAMTDGTIDPEGGQASANALDSDLSAMFAKHPNLIVHWGNGNEEDSHISNVTNYMNTMAAMRTVLNKYIAQGRDISFWIDLTQYNISNNPAIEASLKPAAQYLDGIACSFYPPGRLTVNIPFIRYTDYATFVDPVFALAKNWGISRMDLWETGIGPDTNTAPHDSTSNETATSVKVRKYGQSSLTTITVPNTKQVRPTYAAYMAKYIYEEGKAVGIPVEAMEWWDQVKNNDPVANPDDQLSDDPAGTSPSTATAWHDWPTYAP